MKAPAKGLGLLLAMKPKGEDDGDGPDAEDGTDPIQDAKDAFKKGDTDGGVEALAAYIDRCMQKGE